MRIVSNVSTPSNALVQGPAYLLIRRLQSLTGIVFGAYLLVHLLVNATIAQGGHHYQAQVDKIHGLPFLQGIEWAAIFLPFLVHAIYGVFIAVAGRPNVTHYPYQRNVFYLLQRISAVIILAFILFHVLSLKFGAFGRDLTFIPEEQALASIGHHMSYRWYLPWIVYPIGVIASAYHTANGLWGAAITWGLTVSSTAQRRFGYICAVLGVIMTILGLIAVVASAQLGPMASLPGGEGAAH